MIKISDNEIIKALERCSIDYNCGDCPYYYKDEGRCPDMLMNDALDLINRQQAEIKNLNHSLKCQKDHIEKLAEHSKNQRMEIEELKKENKDLAKRLSDADSMKLTVEYWEQSIKSEAIKEFAEKIKEYRNICPMNGKEYICMDIQEINNLVKEMTEA